MRHQIAFPRTHVLETLLDLLQVNDIAVPTNVDEAFALTQYAVQTRYPGDWEIVVGEEARLALTTAERVLNWVESQLSI